MYGPRYSIWGNPLTSLPPGEEEEEEISTSLGGGGTAGQGGGGSAEGGTTTESYDWDVQFGSAVVASGSSPTQAGAITAAKAAIAGMTAGSYGIVVRKGGATVYTENIEAGTGGTTEGEGGGTAGGGVTPGGGSTTGTGGSGEEGAVLYRYRLVARKWVWDDKTAADPRSWVGHTVDYDAGTSAYTYGNPDEAIEAGKGAATNNTAIFRVYAEPNMKGFASKQFTYTDRLETLTNLGSTESEEAYEDYTTTKDLDLPAAGGDLSFSLDSIPQEAIMAVIAVIVIVAIIAVLISVGGG